MPAIADVVQDLLQTDRPVIFLDTCILLDIVRSIKRRLKNCAVTGDRLWHAVTATPAIHRLVVSHLVRHEWQTHDQTLLLEARRHLAEMEEQSDHLHDACGVFSVVPGFVRATYSTLGIADRLHDLSHRLLQSGLVVEPDDECSGRAMRRVIYNIPPSRKGGEAKDCTILEEYLAVSRQLRAAGFGKKLVFCTSNTNDYFDLGKLAGSLAGEFATIQLDFATNLPQGFHELSK